MDFLDKYKLGFEWDEFDQTELYLVDKKAKIKALLQMVTVPSDIQRVHYLSEGVPSAAVDESFPDRESDGPQPAGSADPDRDQVQMAFEMACMKSLETDSPDDKKSLEMEF